MACELGVPGLALVRNQLIVLVRPSLHGTAGSQPSSSRARVVSGRRTLGSSTGRSTKAMADREPVAAMTSRAMSSTERSSGVPMFTRVAMLLECMRKMPSTVSST